MPKTKIKELLKEIGEIQARDGGEINEYPEYAELADAIKSLRKDNKRLRKENDELIVLNEGMGRRYLKMYCEKPVAEFKCAKTNSPGKIGRYYTVNMHHDNELHISTEWYREDKWQTSNYVKEVIAFTETDPGEIIGALKDRGETLWDKNNWGAGIGNKKYYLVNMGNNTEIAIDVEPEYYFQPEVMGKMSWTEITKEQYENHNK